MNKGTIIKGLSDLLINNIADYKENSNELGSLTTNVCIELNLPPSTITTLLPSLRQLNENDDSSQWMFLCLNFYLLDCLRQELEGGELLSIEETKKVKDIFLNVIKVGIILNLKNDVPFSAKTELSKNFRRMAATVHGLIKCIRSSELRGLVLPHLRQILVAIYQILYQPECTDLPRDVFKQYFQEVEMIITKPMYVQETMLLFQSSSPPWFKKALTENLNKLLVSNKGVQYVAGAMFDGTDDSTKTWKSLEVVVKLILFHRKSPDFRNNICRQITELLNVKDVPIVFERIFVACTKRLYSLDQKLCEETFLEHLKGLLLKFSNKENFTEGEDVTQFMEQAIRLNHFCFLENKPNFAALPIDNLDKTILIIMRLFTNLGYRSQNKFFKEVKEIIVKYFENEDREKVFEILDAYFFSINPRHVPDITNVDFTKRQELVSVKICQFNLIPCTENCGGDILEICSGNGQLSSLLFTYLLNCLTNYDKYFKENSKSDLLGTEDNFVSASVDRRFMVLKVLYILSEDKVVQNYISTNPTYVIKYINKVLNNTIETKLHINEESGSENCQTVFTVIQVLEALLMKSTRDNKVAFEALRTPLSKIKSEAKNSELREYVKKVLDILSGDIPGDVNDVEEEVSDFEKAVKDLTDPLLPVRGHALMTLTKLVEKKHTQAMERQQYILNVFQQNLKNEDSYIYLSAIGGLAAMCDIFPDVVINILTEEYSDFQRKDTEDGHEVRMKLGEVLVRVTSILGEMAPKYKTLLLNTFLVGSKDDDHLIRASSLSNLGEICRVLGYKLGTIVSEVLACVHAIITTDKSIEAQRAAVTVIRQLFVGLENETIAFLKEEILPVYRTLKLIYNTDKDDVMKLQAQLALEELNENMRNFVFPKPELGNKIFVLK